MNQVLKQALSFVVTLNLLVAAFGLPVSYGQTFSEAGVFENEHATAVIPNLSENDQFAVGECSITEGLSEWLGDNQESLSRLISEADQVVVYGLQDEIDNFRRGLGKCRADKVTRLINEWAWNDLFEAAKITSHELQLGNDEKTEVLKEHQKYLNQRGVAIIALYDTNSDFWWPPWLFWLIGGLALLALLFSFLNWLSSDEDNRDMNDRGSDGLSDQASNEERQQSGSPESKNGADEPDDGDEDVDNEGGRDEDDNGVPAAFQPRGHVSVHIHGDNYGEWNIHG
jgi:hypothetical protein